MLKYITVLFVILMAVMDFMAYKKLLRKGVDIKLRRLFSYIAITVNCMPVIAALCMFLFTNIENSVLMMKISMFLFTLFILFILLRLSFYPFWLFSSKKKWMLCGVLLSLSTISTYLYSVFVTRTDYEIKDIEIGFSNLPAEFDGYRVVFISDIHIGSMYNAGKELRELAGVVESTDADIVIFGGDLINLHYTELNPELLDILSGIKGKEQTLSVIGNHDTGTYISKKKDEINENEIIAFKKLVESCGWKILRDSTVYIYKNNDSIAITGIDYSNELLKHKHSFGSVDGFNSSLIYKDVNDSVFNITISHLPQLWYSLCDAGYSDLTLSGHIHAMQFKVSFLGCLFSPAQFMYNEWSGLYEREKGKLYINDGIGTVAYYSRIGSNPEITVITLRKK